MHALLLWHYAGTPYHLVVDVFGGVDPYTDNQTDTLHNVSAVLLVTVGGSVISRLPAVALIHLRQYVATAVLPSTGNTSFQWSWC